MPKREKAKILAAMQKVNASSQEKALAVELEDEMRLFDTVVRAHEETCDFTSDKVSPLLERARAHPIYTQCPPQLVSRFLRIWAAYDERVGPRCSLACASLTSSSYAVACLPLGALKYGY